MFEVISMNDQIQRGAYILNAKIKNWVYIYHKYYRCEKF